jgi:hypothetical protein
MNWLMAGGLAGALAGGIATVELWRRNLLNWLPSYLAWRPEPFDPQQPLRLYFCFVDHYEPLWAGVDDAVGQERVLRWVREYPRLVDPFRDSTGRPAQHSFFFPAEQYRPGYLDLLRQLCQAGYGDVEIHLHHDNDTSAHFVETLSAFIGQLQSHGFLLNRERRNRFGFIHGNWCLNNSRRDGRWCGLNNETALLIQLGCYADFTFPSAPDETQPAMVNSIYYCRDDALKPNAHRRGRPAIVGALPSSDELCLITGPLGFNWRSRKFGLFPRIENGNITGGMTAGAARYTHWFRLGARVLGAPNHVFVKVHTHGTQERVRDAVLGAEAAGMYRALAAMRREGVSLHFVTAYEMWQQVRALESGVRARAPAPAEAPQMAGVKNGAGGGA